MEKIAEETRKEIIRIWLAGHSLNEIVKKVGTSKGSVSNVISELRGSYPGVDLKLVHDVAAEFKQSGFSLQDLMPALRLAQKAKANGITDIGRLDDLMTRLLSLATAASSPTPLSPTSAAHTTGTTSKQLLELLESIMKTAHEQGVPVTEPCELVKACLEELKLARAELAGVTAATAAANNELDQTVRAAGMTRESLAEFKSFKKKLGSYGLHDANKLVKAIENAAIESSWDPRWIAAALSSIDSLGAEKAILLEDKRTIEKHIWVMKNKDRMYKKVSEWPITDKLLQSFSEKLASIARARGKDPKTVSADALLDFINNYGPFVGLRVATNKLNSEIRERQNQAFCLIKIQEDLEKSVSELVGKKRELSAEMAKMVLEMNELQCSLNNLQAKGPSPALC